LLEAPTVHLASPGFLAANGGGGGGGGGASDALPGENGQLSTVAAAGGLGGELMSDGGIGGALTQADFGTDGVTNGGGGGGAPGAIVIRARVRMILGETSPVVIEADLPPVP
jgi:hypothetical protein